MIVPLSAIATELETPTPGDPFVLAPCLELPELRESGAAAVDLRLGTWFLSTKTSRQPVLDIYQDSATKQIPRERDIMRRAYVPIGGSFVLHPRSFVLAATLEWIRMPRRFAGYVTGKSSWGRRGLVIETAPGVHPGFTGCLTLELANVGEIPIVLKPGTRICQMFTHMIDGMGDKAAKSGFIGKRQPHLGELTPNDDFFDRLVKGHRGS